MTRLVIAHKELRKHKLWLGSIEQQEHSMGLLTTGRLFDILIKKRIPDDLTESEQSYIVELEHALTMSD